MTFGPNSFRRSEYQPLYDQVREQKIQLLQSITRARALIYDWLSTEYAPAVAKDLDDPFWHDAELDMYGHWGKR